MVTQFLNYLRTQGYMYQQVSNKFCIKPSMTDFLVASQQEAEGWICYYSRAVPSRLLPKMYIYLLLIVIGHLGRTWRETEKLWESGFTGSACGCTRLLLLLLFLLHLQDEHSDLASEMVLSSSSFLSHFPFPPPPLPPPPSPPPALQWWALQSCVRDGLVAGTSILSLTVASLENWLCEGLVKS